MANMQERLDKAVDRTEADSAVFHRIVHGPDTETVDTEGGGVPTVAKAVKDIQNRVYDKTHNLVEIAQKAADTAAQKAENCSASETAVAGYTKQNEQYVSDIQVWLEGSDEEVKALGGKHSCEQWIRLAQKAVTGSYPTAVSGTAVKGQTLLPLGEALSVPGQILSVIVENTLLLPSAYGLSRDGRNVVLSNAPEEGERWCVQYLTDFQSISSIDNTIVYEEMEAET